MMTFKINDVVTLRSEFERFKLERETLPAPSKYDGLYGQRVLKAPGLYTIVELIEQTCHGGTQHIAVLSPNPETNRLWYVQHSLVPLDELRAEMIKYKAQPESDADHA